MTKRVWIFRQKKEVARKGADAASWYVGWYDLQGRRHSESCGPGSRGKNHAEKRLRRVQSELDTGVHQPNNRKAWAEFRTEYEERILSGLAPRTRDAAADSLGHFERIVRPGRVQAVTTAVVDQFIATRRQEAGLKPGSIVSPATINKDLRHIKAALRVAREWGYLPDVPKVRMVKEPQRLPTYVTPDHFDLIYRTACDLARFPKVPRVAFSPADWWRALVVTAYMTGLRVGELLALRTEDLDLDAGELIARWDDTKADRDEVIPLHPAVAEHLRKLSGCDPMVFPWPHDPRTLGVEFTRIQAEAGIHMTCRDRHEHTPSCHVYGFHDFRRAFATVNAPRLKPEVLQRLMRHKSYQTTQKFYINPTSQMQDAVTQMPLPGVLRPKQAESSRDPEASGDGRPSDAAEGQGDQYQPG
jgi:integrase